MTYQKDKGSVMLQEERVNEIRKLVIENKKSTGKVNCAKDTR